jgi:phosphotransferase system  glucose/maltose/N-acetylglucosamine-specific IIC component
MGDTSTTPDATDSTETGNVPHRLRRWIGAHQHRLPTKRRLVAVAYGLFALASFIGITAAQQGGGGGGGGGSVGSQLCGTVIAQTVNQLAPIILGVVIVGGLMLGYTLHAWSGFKKDPQKVQNIRDWRNRAITSAITAPLLGKLLELVIGFMGIGLAGCIDIVPFI